MGAWAGHRDKRAFRPAVVAPELEGIAERPLALGSIDTDRSGGTRRGAVQNGRPSEGGEPTIELGGALPRKDIHARAFEQCGGPRGAPLEVAPRVDDRQWAGRSRRAGHLGESGRDGPPRGCGEVVMSEAESLSISEQLGGERRSSGSGVVLPLLESIGEESMHRANDLAAIADTV